jgi:hypothetical protein
LKDEIEKKINKRRRKWLESTQLNLSKPWLESLDGDNFIEKKNWNK